ncbi:heme utilization protein [Methylobacterium sp. NEAU 140]|uniref:heme utilization protein n=1 Tax=Methylobacterium sp. NEAU 140 TaxID=3064945 RepID=UPI0027366807|nr:heme utilization protein [Methylobacterium sp. NEAU 140]MDP4026673.1 heme utilization protein [Methylobacterium sp. NEAU 140]
MARLLTLILSSGLLLTAFGRADAAKKKVDVPDRFDGSWSITALSTSGPCAKSTSYSVNIKNGDASIPGDVDIDGGVSASGVVQATIIQGANKAPITGHLDPDGSGSGTWRTSGGLVECSGSWSAKRSG